MLTAEFLAPPQQDRVAVTHEAPVGDRVPSDILAPMLKRLEKTPFGLSFTRHANGSPLRGSIAKAISPTGNRMLDILVYGSAEHQRSCLFQVMLSLQGEILQARQLSPRLSDGSSFLAPVEAAPLLKDLELLFQAILEAEAAPADAAGGFPTLVQEHAGTFYALTHWDCAASA